MAPRPVMCLALLRLAMLVSGASQATDPSSSQGSEAPDSYRKFMTDYRRYLDYKQHMKQGGASEGSIPDFESFAANYQRFMDFKQRQGSQVTRSPGAPVSLVAESSSDASDDVQSSSASSAGGQQMGAGMGGFDYSHYIPGGTMGGPSGGLAGQTADFQKYMNYSKYMDMKDQYTKTNWMNSWQKFQQDQQGGQQAPASATDCKTETELNAWRQKQTDIAKQWIPKAYQGPTLDNIEKDYKTNLERIKNPPQDAATDQAIADAAGQDPLLLPSSSRSDVALSAPEPRAQAFKASLPDLSQARVASSVEELIAWRADMGDLVEQLPAKEQEEWNEVLSQELQAGLTRLQIDAAAAPESLAAAPKASKARSRALEFSRTMLVFVVSFCVPVAAVYVWRGIKQATRPGTDYDAQFMALDRGDDLL